MATSLHTFINIFNSYFEVGKEEVKLTKIVIPIIQRDYAQGRKNSEVERIRRRFLRSLYDAFTDKPLTLDFVYGDININGILTPLDGQQRLTTLFLLHWYAAQKENIDDSECLFLHNFTYETRYSARDFCERLVNDYKPSFTEKLSDEIIDQVWFPLDWAKDPTISSMLVMLDAISDTFANIPDIWERLNNDVITFYFLPIKDMGLTDELYIKMNSRGKPLTQFEHFKAELEHELQLIDKDIAKRIIKEIDIDWTDMLWRYRGKNNVTDDEFLSYFRFICDILCYKSGGTPQGKSYDEFVLLDTYFSSNNKDVLHNIDVFEKFFNCWIDIPEYFFEQFISHEHSTNKIKMDDKINIFEECLQGYKESTGETKRHLSLNKVIFLYAVIQYLLNTDTVSYEMFLRRIRIVNNLIQNSRDEISDSEQRTGGNKIPAMLEQIDSIMLDGKINRNIEYNFNANQLDEEIMKSAWIEINSYRAEDLYQLEDHDLLYGQISIIGLEHPEYFSRFASLFSCNWDKVNCALISIGQYGQNEKNGWRHQLGSMNKKSWSSLFHKSANIGFENTKKLLAELLSKADTFTDDYLIEIADSYITISEENSIYDWRYYYIKYDVFRSSGFGKYYWNNFHDRPYELIVMYSEKKLSENAYQPFLKAVDKIHLSKEHFGQRLIIGNKYITCDNSAYVVKDNDTDAETDRLTIIQDSNGFDIEDRIQKLLQSDILKKFIISI